MFDPASIATALAAYYAGRRLAGRWSRPRPPAPVYTPPAPSVPATIAYEYPLFTPVRGANRTTQAGVMRQLSADPGPLFALAGVLWPAFRYLNKLTLITGRPEAGKTVMVRMMMASVGRLFGLLQELAECGRYPGDGMMRWLVVDPTNAYLPYLYQCLPGDVPITRATPVDLGGKRWDIARDITSDALNEALQAGLFPESLFRKAGDPFWYNKAREITQGIVTVYHDLGSDWQFHDIIVPIKYPQFLKPLLEQSPRTRGISQHELVGRLGRDIIATSSSVVNRMAIAAALWQRAEDAFSLRDFLDRRGVLHFAYTPDQITVLSGVANAMIHVLVLLGISRNDPHNHTILWLDEGRYLADLAGLEDLAARGRGAGFGAVYAAQGIPGLMNKWGELRVRELLDITCTWVAMSAGPETAEAFCRAVGKVEGIQETFGSSLTHSFTETWGWNTSRTLSFQSNSTTRGKSGSTSRSTSSSSSRSFSLTIKDAILSSELTNLPLASGALDRVCGFAFNPEVGAFEFDAPFLHHFEGLPEPPFAAMPTRPDAEQRLYPWTPDDIRRLKLKPTPELIAAVANTWKEIGG